MEDLANIYLQELENREEFIELLNLKVLIEKKYGNLIIAMKTKEAIYLEALDKKDHYNLDLVKKEFSQAKASLYSKEEVKKYFELEKKLNKILESDFNHIKEAISNKFLKKHMLEID